MENSAHILVVEDEEDLLEVVLYNLSKYGYSASGAVSAEAAEQDLEKKRPDLILLDIMLPGISGLEFCKKIKSTRSWESIPVMIITAMGEDEDIVKGLELGADEFVTKPISPKVLLARIQSIIRRVGQKPRTVPTDLLSYGPLTLNLQKHHCTMAGESLALTQSEFGALELLMQKPGWVFTRSQIMEHIKGESLSATQRSVDVVVVGLRKKIGEMGKAVKTVRGIGYKLEEETP